VSGRTVRIGLTGPIGCGKSTVASWLGESGAEIIDADEVAREVTRLGMPAVAAIAAAFGGEVALGVDGPVLPEPSWKLVAEVYDPAHLQQTFEKAVAQINTELRSNGKPGLQITRETSGGRTFYALEANQPKVGIHYLFEDGYMLAAPSRALLERSLQQRESGVTLATTPKFRDLLGPDGQVNVSALIYQNLAPLAQAANKVIPSGDNGHGRNAPSGPARLGKLLAAQGPTLYYAYAEPDRIVFAGSNQNPLGLNLGTLASMGGIVGMMNEAHDQAAQSEAR